MEGQRLTKSQRTRARIVESAVEVFLENGFEKTTASLIMDRVGMSYGTFYQHFENKETLLVQLGKELSAHVADPPKLTAGADFKEALFLGTLHIVRYYRANRPLILVLHNAAPRNPEIQRAFGEVHDNLFKRIEHVIKHYCSRGYCREYVNEHEILAVSVMIEEFTMAKLLGSEDEFDERLIARVLSNICYYGLFKHESLAVTRDTGRTHPS